MKTNLINTILLKRTVACALLLLLTSIAPLASANQFFVVSAGAYHFKNQDERNAFTPGVGWEFSPSKKAGFHVGTLSDSFGYQATYAGVNWASGALRLGPTNMRLILGATVVNKQFHKNSEPETKILPLPALEFSLSKRAVLNISGSPQLDYAGQKNNAIVFFQFKWNTK